MKKVEIKDKASGVITHGAIKDDLEFQQWIDENRSAFGKDAWVETTQYEVQDDPGNIIQPAIYVNHDAEFEIIVADITAQIEKEQEITRRKEAREACLGILDEIAAYNLATNQSLNPVFSSPTFTQIILALTTGAPKSAAAGIRAVGPQVYPQQLVEEFAAKLEAL